MENPGIDPGTSHMQSERSTIWANPPNITSLLNDLDSFDRTNNDFTLAKSQKLFIS